MPIQNVIEAYGSHVIGEQINGGGGSGGSGGHVIQNPAGTNMEQRDTMQFVDAQVTDDSTNAKTKVQLVREMTKAQFNALSADEKKGVIRVTDENGVVLNADEIYYDNTESGFIATNVQNAIDEAANKGGLKPHIIIISDTGSTVTLTKGTKIISAQETSTGHFEADVDEFGTWVIDAILDGYDAQVSLAVDTVKIYTIDDSHFYANITVTYPNGSTCNLSGGGESSYATGSPYTFTVHSADTYTITVNYNSNTYTDTVVVSASGGTFAKTVPSVANAPANDVNCWLMFGGVNGNYSTLSDVLADSSALSTLMANTNAVNYLVRCTSWISTITGNQSAMSYIGLNNYCADTLLANSTWLTSICNSTYFEKVLNVKVPTMTSDTAPRGQVLYGGQNVTQYGNYSAFYAFDGKNSTQAIPQSSANWNTSGYIGYKFTTPVKVRKVHEEAGLYVSRVETIQASTNGSSWVTLKSSYTASPRNGSWVTFNHVFVNNTAYQYYRISFGNPQSEGWNYYNNLQFYGR